MKPLYIIKPILVPSRHTSNMIKAWGLYKKRRFWLGYKMIGYDYSSTNIRDIKNHLLLPEKEYVAGSKDVL